MRTKRSIRALLTSAIVCVVIAGLAPGAASAAPGPNTPTPTSETLHATATPTGKNKAAPLDLNCEGTPTPYPMYSASNKTIHWGGFVQCDQVATLTFTIYLYIVTGHGSHLNRTQESSHTEGTVSTTLSDSWPFACLTTTAHNWQSRIKATADGIALLPVGGAYSPIENLPCS